MNFLKKVYSTPKMKALKRKRAELEKKKKELSRKFKATFKAESKRLKKQNTKKTKKGKKKKVELNDWQKFVKLKMSRYMKKYGSHAKAMKQISKEWKKKRK